MNEQEDERSERATKNLKKNTKKVVIKVSIKIILKMAAIETLETIKLKNQSNWHTKIAKVKAKAKIRKNIKQIKR